MHNPKKKYALRHLVLDLDWIKLRNALQFTLPSRSRTAESFFKDIRDMVTSIFSRIILYTIVYDIRYSYLIYYSCILRRYKWKRTCTQTQH